MDALFLLCLWFSHEVFYTVMSFHEASEDTGFHCFCFFSLQLFVAILAVSFSPSLLRSFASSVQGEVSEKWASGDDGPETASGDDGPETASGDDGPETASGDDGPEATCLEMTAALVSEHRLGRQSSVLSPWRVPQARCK